MRVAEKLDWKGLNPTCFAKLDSYLLRASICIEQKVVETIQRTLP
jgi:hypothetical protein